MDTSTTIFRGQQAFAFRMNVSPDDSLYTALLIVMIICCGSAVCIIDTGALQVNQLGRRCVYRGISVNLKSQYPILSKYGTLVVLG